MEQQQQKKLNKKRKRKKNKFNNTLTQFSICIMHKYLLFIYLSPHETEKKKENGNFIYCVLIDTIGWFCS